MSRDFYRVTEILSPYVDFSHIPPKVLNKAAERGNIIHDMCEKYVKEEFFIIDERYELYFFSFRNWYDKYVEHLYVVEERLWNLELRLTGKIDLLLKMKGDGYGSTLIDIKTPQAPSLSWNLQTAAYQWLCENENAWHISRRACLILSKEGRTAKLIEYTDYPSSWQTYRGLLDAFVFFDQNECNPYCKKPQDEDLLLEWKAYLLKRENRV